MYDIYVIEEVVSKLPLTAVSISAIAEKDELLIGTRAGHLICCSNSKGANPNSYVYQLCRTFEKGVILEICVVETHNIIVCLTEAHLSMHEAIDPFRLIGSLARFKPIPCFACHVEQKEIFFVVSTKNRLIIFKKMEQDFEKMASIDLSESALRIIWSNSNSLFIAVKSEFQFAKLSFLQKQVPNSAKVVTSIDITEYPKVLFSTGQRANETIPSLIVELSDQKLVGLCRDDKVVDFFCAESGSMARDNSCRFSDSLLDLAYDAPYLVGLLPTNTVEMRSISPPLLVQKITLPKVSMLSVGSRGLVYAASETQAWKLNGLARVAEIFKQLKEEKQFELALQLANSHQQLRSQLVDLKRQMAADCFNQRKFTKCFDLHAELNTDVLFVVNLFPNFMPEKYKALIAQLQTKEFQLYDVSREMLPEKEQKSAIQALNQYLSVKRNQHSKPISLHYLDYKEGQTENILPVNELKRHEASLELIDTILLKCYLQVNPTLVGSLLRVKNCCCIISEAEKDLKEHKMFDELLILYERKKMHRKYLELLTREIKAQGPGGGDIGVEKIVSFLMTLKRDQMPLILEFSTAVLAVDMKRGVQIFTGDGSEHNSDAKNFDRDTILQFLKKDHPDAVIPYLEHIINMWKDERPKFHEELLFQYISYIRAMLTDFLKSMAGTNPIKNPIGDKLTMMKKKLKFFLENDQHYTVKDALKLIELDENLIEERAILCGRMGQHTEALNIYTNILMDFRGAERHCQLYASEKNPLFYNLFHYYISADPNESKNANKSNAIQRRQNITEALKLLRRHATNINIVSAFALIPSETSLSRLTDALKAVFESLNNRMTSVKLLLSLTNIAIKRTETHLKHLTQQRIHINERVECCLCKKRIMQSAFVRHRNSSISHFFCYKSNQERRP